MAKVKLSTLFVDAGPVHTEVRKSAIEGKGLFAKVSLPVRRKIGEYAGELISQAEARRRVKTLNRIAIVELGNGKAIDGSRGGNHFQYINHSCSPNTFMRRFHHRVEFYALSPIEPGEELTCDYGESHHNGTRRCTCRSRTCRGYI